MPPRTGPLPPRPPLHATAPAIKGVGHRRRPLFSPTPLFNSQGARAMCLWPLPLVQAGRRGTVGFVRNQSRRNRLSPILVSSTRTTSPTSIGPRLTFPLLPRCYRRSPTPLRVTGGYHHCRSTTAPPVSAASPMTHNYGEPHPPTLVRRIVLSTLVLVPPELEDHLT
jgi:hypothetical protein